MYTHHPNGVLVWPVAFMIDSSSILKFIATDITESSPFVSIMMGPISTTKLLTDL